MLDLKKYFAEVRKLYKHYFATRQFVFDFDYYDGTETDNNHVIADQNVYEYEFINQGASICLINGLKLYPKFAGIPPYRVKLDNRFREKDVQVYKYSFIPLDFQVCYPLHLSQVEDLLSVGSATAVGPNYVTEATLNGMEFDGGGCPVMIPAENSKICVLKICTKNWFSGFATCNFDFIYQIDGQDVNNLFSVTNPSDIATIQALIIANLKFPFLAVNVLVTQEGVDLCVEFSNVVLISGTGVLTLILTTDCLFPPDSFQTVQVCKFDLINSLLVISKLPGKRKKTHLAPP